MKPTTLFLTLTLIFLFTNPSLSSKAIVDDDTLVFDRDGNPLQKDASYFIAPPIRGPLGSPVMLASPNSDGENKTCEADVIQPFVGGPSTPFTFTPVYEDAIKLGYPLAIQSTESPCEGSTVWKVSTRSITTGGIANTPSSCLRITKPREPMFLNTYMFEYCPNLCGAAPKICLPIGTTMERLSPKAAEPFEFVLIKVSESAAMI